LSIGNNSLPNGIAVQISQAAVEAAPVRCAEVQKTQGPYLCKVWSKNPPFEVTEAAI
jgi:hypothetical protein